MEMRNNEVEIYPGFKFRPTDHELVDFLMNKVKYGSPLPGKIFMEKMIKEINIYAYNPDRVTAEHKFGYDGDEWYFLTTPIKKFENGKKTICRIAGDGYWHISTNNKIRDKEGVLIAIKRQFNFLTGKNPKEAVKTDWIMHEVVLVDTDGEMMMEWVLCRMYRKTKINGTAVKRTREQLNEPVALESRMSTMPNNTNHHLTQHENVQHIPQMVNTYQPINEGLVVCMDCVEQNNVYATMAVQHENDDRVIYEVDAINNQQVWTTTDEDPISNPQGLMANDERQIIISEDSLVVASIPIIHNDEELIMTDPIPEWSETFVPSDHDDFMPNVEPGEDRALDYDEDPVEQQQQLALPVEPALTTNYGEFNHGGEIENLTFTSSSSWCIAEDDDLFRRIDALRTTTTSVSPAAAIAYSNIESGFPSSVTNHCNTTPHWSQYSALQLPHNSLEQYELNEDGMQIDYQLWDFST